MHVRLEKNNFKVSHYQLIGTLAFELGGDCSEDLVERGKVPPVQKCIAEQNLT